MPERRFTILSTTTLPTEQLDYPSKEMDVRIIPFIDILPISSDKIKTQIEKYAAGKKTVVFTSAHAVNSVTRFLQQIPAWDIYCVGKATRSAIEKWFGENCIIASAKNAQVLSEIIIADGIPQAVFFCGDQRMDILPENLKNHHILLDELVVYETRLTPVQVEEPLDAILFFSPTAVKSFFSMNTLSAETKIFAMGSTTAAVLKENTTNPVIISPEPEKAFVFNMALEYAGAHPIQ